MNKQVSGIRELFGLLIINSFSYRPIGLKDFMDLALFKKYIIILLLLLLLFYICL